MTNDDLLIDYQKNKRSVELVIRYRPLLQKLAKLCKGVYKERDALSTWFYGLFLNGNPRTPMALLDVRDRVIECTFHLTYHDCYNQVMTFFLEMAKKYKQEPGKSGFHQYIRMVLGWRTKHWVDTLLSEGAVVFPEYFEGIEYPDDVEPMKLSLEWVLYGSSNPMFKGLRPYDRYLVYLYFVENMTLRRIAHHTFQSKNTVSGDLDIILSKCRENARD